MPHTKKQQAAARAEYGRRKKGKRLLFKGMSMAQLRKWAKAKKLEKKKKKKKKKKGNPHPKKKSCK